MKTDLVIIAHGSRHGEANADLHHLVEELRRQNRFDRVEAAFLELAEPTMEDAAVSCALQGAQRLILVPYFLSAGVHVGRDLTSLRDRLRERFPQVDVRLAEPLGRHPLLLEIITERIRQAEELPQGRTGQPST